MSDDVFDKVDVNRMAEDAFRKSTDAFKNAEIGKTKKVLGFEVDAGVAGAIYSLYSIVANFFTNIIQPNIYDLTKKYAKQAGVEGNALNKVAAGVATTVTVAVKAGGLVPPIFESYRQQRKDRIALAHNLAPVLDDLKGRHSVGALRSVKAEDNEVIYVQRKRMASIANSKNFGAFVNLGINAGSNLATDLPAMAAMLTHKGNADASYYEITHPDEFNALKPKEKKPKLDAEPAAEAEAGKAKKTKKADDKAKITVGSINNKVEYKTLLGSSISVAAGQIASRIADTHDKKLSETLQPYSAYEMIDELEKQVIGNPKSSSFREPKPFSGGKGNQRSYPLEEYVMRIFIQHQKDMSDISPDHTEIREALKDDLVKIAKPIAEAIRKGEMSPMSLVRLVGEGKIIKNRGRALADVSEVLTLIERDEPKQTSYVHVDPKDYHKKTSFTPEENRKAFHILEGDDRTHMVMLQPDSVLEAAGVSAQEIKDHRAKVTDTDRKLADAIIGLEQKSEDELREKNGMARQERELLHEDYCKIERDGLKAVHDLRAGPTNDHGVELLIANAVMSPIVSGGEKHYLGTLIQEGHAKFDDVASERGENKGRGARKEENKSRMRPNEPLFEEDEYGETKHKSHLSDLEKRRASHSQDTYAERD